MHKFWQIYNDFNSRGIKLLKIDLIDPKIMGFRSQRASKNR